MKILKSIAITVLVLFLNTMGVSTAQADPLTQQQVKNFISSMPQLIALGDKYNDTTKRNIDPSRPLGSSLELMGGKGDEYTELKQLALKSGFSSVEQWADVGDRTLQAYIVASTAMPAEEIEALYQQGVANIKNDTQLSGAQKEMILSRMAETHKRNSMSRETSAADLAAIQPFLAELDRLLE